MDIVNVLWIDDHCKEKKLSHIINSAKEKGIILHGFEWGISGINALKDNFDSYDAILLDVKSKYNKDDIDEISNIDLIKEDLQKIMAGKREIPIFYLTSKYSESTNRFPKNHEVFNKSNILIEQDYSLWDSICNKIKSNKLNILRNKYIELLNLGKLIDSKINNDLNIEKKIFALAAQLSGVKPDEEWPIKIRMILDGIFLYLLDIGCGTEHYITDKHSVNITSAFRYFQYYQKEPYKEKLNNGRVITIRSPKNKLDFVPFSKKIGNSEYKYFLNNNPFPSDISNILWILIGSDSTPVQGLNHGQKKVKNNDTSHYQNLKSNKYHTAIYINSLFTLLLWFKETYIYMQD